MPRTPWITAAHSLPSTSTAARTGPILGVVLHWTATPYCDADGELRRLRNWALRGGSSTHFVIGRGGQLYQLVALDEAANHTRDRGEGRARWSRPGTRFNDPVDGWTIGIDLVNVGPLTREPRHTVCGLDAMEAPERWLNPYRQIHRGPIAQHRSQFFEPYTAPQRTALAALVVELCRRYPALSHREAWVGHRDIQPGKIDPGPLFPWEVIEQAIERVRACSATGS